MPEKFDDFGKKFLERVAAMPEGGVLFLQIADKSPENYAMLICSDTLDNFAGFVNRGGNKIAACVVSMLLRPGSSLFWMMLEHTWFDPTGPDEHLYLCAWTRWQDQIWVIGLVPAALGWTFDEAAKRTGMKIADGCPMVFDSEGEQRFPIPWAKTLVNGSPDDPHYKASAEGLRMLMEGTISPQEFTRRVSGAERGMINQEFEKIKQFYRDRGIPSDFLDDDPSR